VNGDSRPQLQEVQSAISQIARAPGLVALAPAELKAESHLCAPLFLGSTKDVGPP
jgi:hypothetical protein